LKKHMNEPDHKGSKPGIRVKKSNFSTDPSNSNSILSPSLGYISKDGSLKEKKRKTRRTLNIILIILIAFILFFIFRMVYENRKEPANGTIESESSSLPSDSFSESSASLSDSVSSQSSIGNTSDIDSQKRVLQFADLQKDITDYTDQFDGRIGVFYINLTNGETFGVDEEDPFVAASSIKLALATQYYQSISMGTFKLTDMLSYDSRPYTIGGDMEYGTGVIIHEPNGTQFSARRTAQLAITISDNCATNMMIRKLGGIDSIMPHLYEISGTVKYRDPISYTDYKGAIITQQRHRISALDLALYAANFYALWSESKEDYQPLMDDLQNTVFDFGIHKKLPSEVRVAHKIGTNYDWRTENDVGIVFADEPYVLCVTTEGRDQTAGRAASADISLLIYRYITGLYPTS
jgi:beta-lactamase class A